MSLFLITSYAAFNANISLNAKGNIKVVYKTVSFTTELIINNDFENGFDGWGYNGIPEEFTCEVDENIKYNDKKVIRLYEQENSTGYNGPNYYIVKRKLDLNKKYELSAMFYRDSTSVYGDLNNYVRMYATLGDENKTYQTWLKMDKNSFMSKECAFGACLVINSQTLPDKTWTLISGVGNNQVGATITTPYIWKFNIDYYNGGPALTSNIWVSDIHFHEIEEKSVRKGSKVGTLPIATMDGYTFTGWYTEENGGVQVTSDTVIKDDVSYYARFTKN